jgi:Pyruvate/2-oxoacid:ferredoxin oxidoreductase delta subunit
MRRLEMGHITARSGYEQLVDRLNRFPQGAPPSETLYKILGILFDEEEAKLVSQLPIQSFVAAEAAKRWKLPEMDAVEILDRLARRALLVDYVKDGTTYYVLPPPMAGWIEFSMMRIREDIDQQSLGQLLHQYMNVEEEFVKNLFFGSKTKIVRTFVNEEALLKSATQNNHKHVKSDGDLEIMDYERASHIIHTAEHIGISTCYCRHKMEHVGQNCDAPMEICMTFGKTADSLIRSDYARRIDVKECLELLEVAYAHNLVQIGENVQNEVAFICNCCGCCCEALLAAQKLGTSQTIATTNFLPRVKLENCKKCGKCISVCPVSALGDKGDANGRTPIVQETMCLGCGVCIRNCHFDALVLEPVDQRRITPVNSAHRIVLMALDKGTLANLIYDNQSLASHRILGALFTAILALPPAKQLAANEQLRSKYLANLLAKRTNQET